jgi:hypothetical protein
MSAKPVTVEEQISHQLDCVSSVNTALKRGLAGATAVAIEEAILASLRRVAALEAVATRAEELASRMKDWITLPGEYDNLVDALDALNKTES